MIFTSNHSTVEIHVIFSSIILFLFVGLAFFWSEWYEFVITKRKENKKQKEKEKKLVAVFYFRGFVTNKLIQVDELHLLILKILVS